VIIIHQMVNFVDVEALEEFMTRPSRELAADLARAPGDLLILGVGGKMGPTLARMAKRAAPERRVIGVARFSDKALRAKLEAQGVECIECDLLERVALERLPQTRVTARSGLYRSAPVGHREQPDFVNAVARLETGLAPDALWNALQAIERAHGRERSFRNAPRTLDLDLLLYGEARIDTPGLTVPHPRMHARAFVLKPLLELDPQANIPGKGSAAGLLAACAAQRVERV